MTWFKALAGDDNCVDIRINGQIGEDWWSGNGTTAQGFIDEVEALGTIKTINLHINSPGGDVADGLTIFNYLRNHSANIIVTIESQAASIASVIAMAGNEIVMGIGATMMVHNPWTWASGNANDFRKMANDLDVITAGLIDSYAFKSGKGHDEIKALLDGETYMTAKEAVEHGFADREDVELKAAASANMGEVKVRAQMSAVVKGKDAAIDGLTAQVKALTDSAKPPTAEDPKKVIALCAENKLDGLANNLVSTGATAEQVKAHISNAKAIQTVCTAANIDASSAIEKMDDTAALLGYAIHEALAAADPDQDNHLSPGAGTSQAKVPSAKAVYAQLNQ